MNLKFTIASLFILVQALAAQPLNDNSLSKTNTPYDELNPVISPDGRTLFVTIANHPENLGGKKDPGDIWFCTLTGSTGWSEPVHAGSLINDRGFNTIAGFSSDGQEMVLLGHYDPAGNAPRPPAPRPRNPPRRLQGPLLPSTPGPPGSSPRCRRPRR